jgi:hypothetical protein
MEPAEHQIPISSDSPHDEDLRYVLSDLLGESSASQPDLSEAEQARAELVEVLFGEENIADDQPFADDFIDSVSEEELGL